ncbi:MAG: mechanosensitive ion channel [Brumimicrobium sp.]|nr:mechanosensitive ion channel [Brumimicrobium sp.]MCO5269134.1 mechanosensitive ion channel family protein [Brumimicrobium sp.]
MREIILDWIKSLYGISSSSSIRSLIRNHDFQKHEVLWVLGLLVALAVVFFLLWFIARKILLLVIKPISKKSKTKFDDYLIETGFFKILANLFPLLFLNYFFSIVFFSLPTVLKGSYKVTEIILAIVILISIRRFLNAVGLLLKEKPYFKDKPIGAYIQTGKLIITFIFIVILLSTLTDQSPTFIFTSLGAMTAVLLLVFKDTLLGFVGSIQISINDMVRVGDWIEIEKFGADGEVKEITLTTVKVQNWDKTITTIPTYNLISDSFKNWRGMLESNGRRIKRSINIKIDSIKFADDKLINRLSKVKILTEFIENQRKAIEEHNQKYGLIDEYQINARRPTNVGLFRRYIEYYIKNNQGVREDMARVVRQLPPTTKGLPLEIYCFSDLQNMEGYEIIMADIFDHVFAIIDFFELEIHQDPTGSDIRILKK